MRGAAVVGGREADSGCRGDAAVVGGVCCEMRNSDNVTMIIVNTVLIAFLVT